MALGWPSAPVPTFTADSMARSSAAHLFLDTAEIADLWHTQEHLCEVARAVYGTGLPVGRAWWRRP